MTSTAIDPAPSTPVVAERIDVGLLLRNALAFHQAGRLAEAEDLYRRILAAQPRHFDGLHLLGVVFSQRGQHADAVRQIEAAIAVNPNIAAAHNNCGVSLNALGRAEEALASFEKALALDSNYLDALRNRADTLLGMKRFEEAIGSYDRAILLSPNAADLFLKRGHALTALNRLEQAIASYDGAVVRDPNSRDGFFYRGMLLAKLGRLEEAIASYDKAISFNPNDAEALNNRGAALNALRRFCDALASCDRAIALDPNLAASFSNRGMALKEMNRLEEALASYDTAIRLQPGLGEAHSNRANLLASLRRFDEAISGYQHALVVNPRDATARCNLGMVKLLTGRFNEGWADWEARWEIGAMTADRCRFPQPRWTGDTGIEGRRLLLSAEQGLGDTIMAMRYVRQLVDRGATVIVEAPAATRSLLTRAAPECEIVGQGEPLPDFDLYCPLLSLPRAFKTTLGTIPAEVPYLSACASRVAAWRKRLETSNGVKIGLVWAGNPQHTNDARRSIGLQQLLPLLSHTHASFVSLQKELRLDDAEILNAHPRITHFGPELESFEDTAALVSLLDLVICVDTSVAHLAGALGKPVWVLLPFVPDWRWLLDREDSPWYPTARLFRQSMHGDWSNVVERVSAEIDRLASACGQR